MINFIYLLGKNKGMEFGWKLWVFLVLVGSMILNVWVQPYYSKYDDRLEVLALTGLLLILFVAEGLYNESKELAEGFVLVTLIVVTLAFVAIKYFSSSAHQTATKYGSKKNGAKKSCCICQIGETQHPRWPPVKPARKVTYRVTIWTAESDGCDDPGIASNALINIRGHVRSRDGVEERRSTGLFLLGDSFRAGGKLEIDVEAKHVGTIDGLALGHGARDSSCSHGSNYWHELQRRCRCCCSSIDAEQDIWRVERVCVEHLNSLQKLTFVGKNVKRFRAKDTGEKTLEDNMTDLEYFDLGWRTGSPTPESKTETGRSTQLRAPPKLPSLHLAPEETPLLEPESEVDDTRMGKTNGFGTRDGDEVRTRATRAELESEPEPETGRPEPEPEDNMTDLENVDLGWRTGSPTPESKTETG
eukprot:SAG22_NODE_1109_length_5541_cov_52.079750_2_plen_415_part_01